MIIEEIKVFILTCVVVNVYVSMNDELNYKEHCSLIYLKACKMFSYYTMQKQN